MALQTAYLTLVFMILLVHSAPKAAAIIIQQPGMPARMQSNATSAASYALEIACTYGNFGGPDLGLDPDACAATTLAAGKECFCYAFNTDYLATSGGHRCWAANLDCTNPSWADASHIPDGNGGCMYNVYRASATTAGATGDPHLQNVHGERFDLMKPGKHVLVQIPREEGAEKALLRVEAQASKLGGQCEDIYFTELNITGTWACAKQAGGYYFQAREEADSTGKWVAMGNIELKVVHGRTEAGSQYLNFYIKHLGRTGFDVGGLLGEEDHSDVSTPMAECVQHMSLAKPRARVNGSGSSATAVATATFA